MQPDRTENPIEKPLSSRGPENGTRRRRQEVH
jgi:hypothetical protein